MVITAALTLRVHTLSGRRDTSDPSRKVICRSSVGTVDSLVSIVPGRGPIGPEDAQPPSPNEQAANGSLSPYQPPGRSFTVGPYSVTATVHNPNNDGICFATVGNNGSAWIMGDHTEAGYAHAGQTIMVTKSDMTLGVTIASGFCGATENTPPLTKGEDFTLTVPDDKPRATQPVAATSRASAIG